MRQVFPSVYIVDEPDNGSTLGNSMVVATRRPTTLEDLRANLPALRSSPAGGGRPPRRAAGPPRKPPRGTPIFTDDRAPVEQVVHRLVLSHMLGN